MNAQRVAVGVFWVLSKLIDFVSSLISVSRPHQLHSSSRAR